MALHLNPLLSKADDRNGDNSFFLNTWAHLKIVFLTHTRVMTELTYVIIDENDTNSWDNFFSLQKMGDNKMQ